MADDKSNATLYKLLKELLINPQAAQHFLGNPDAVLAGENITDQAEAQFFKNFVAQIANAGRPGVPQDQMKDFVATQMKSTSETSDRFKQGLQRTLEQIDQGFRGIMVMYYTAFALGVVLILMAAVMAMIGHNPLLPAIFGGLGIVDFIGFFITSPPRELQRSRADLAQLQAAYFTWFGDVYNWNSLLMEYSSRGQGDFELMSKVSTSIITNTEKILEIVEKYCEFRK